MPQVLQNLRTKEYGIKISHSDERRISPLFLGFGSIIRQNTFLCRLSGLSQESYWLDKGFSLESKDY